MEKNFKCCKCDREIPYESYGTKNRNHCPFCLWSKHVDEKIGDRLSRCGGSMKPLGLNSKKDGELMLIHECEKCGKISANRIAGDDAADEILEIFKNSLENKGEIEKKSGHKLFIDEDELKVQLFGK